MKRPLNAAREAMSPLERLRDLEAAVFGTFFTGAPSPVELAAKELENKPGTITLNPGAVIPPKHGA